MEGGIPPTFSLSIRERAHREHIAHGIGTTEGRCARTTPRNAHARRPRPRAAHAPPRTAAREQSRDRSRGQSGLFMRMQKTPSKAL